MELVIALLILVCLSGFFLGFASLGDMALRFVRSAMVSDVDHTLISVAIGILIIENVVFVFEANQQIRPGSLLIVGILLGVVMFEWKSVSKRLVGAFFEVVPPSRLGAFLLISLVVVSCVEFLASMAPLNGSDALHYHFTVEKEILEHGFYPIFSNSHSFLCGQNHLLILLGLALGSEHLAMGFILLGGLLTAAALARLISYWSSYNIAAAFVLLFLLTPVVFWQISAAGSPDIFMAFFASTAVLVLRQEGSRIWQPIAVAGFLVGGIAGAKYTGCAIALAFLLVVLVEFRSVLDIVIFILASLISGSSTYLRNLVWTGNPIFPFLSGRSSHGLVTTAALSNLVNDTQSESMHRLSNIFPFIFLAAVQKERLGFWDVFGPTVLALAPLMLMAFRNTRSWRIPILAWFLSSICILSVSGLPRFLLAIFPIALSCVGAGLYASWSRNFTIANTTGTALVVLLIFYGAVGLATYSAKPILAVVGAINRTTYLEQSSPEYQIVEVVNRRLEGQDGKLSALVFLRHLYYLDIKYINGDPGTSFDVDPAKLQTAEEWKQFFNKKSIGYVVRSPEYPGSIAQPLTELERSGELVPIDDVEVQNFVGMRIDETKNTVHVVILKFLGKAI